MSNVRLHRLLAQPSHQLRFSGVPIDWWDEPAGRWRPAVITRISPDHRRDRAVEILVPLLEGFERCMVAAAPMRVALSAVRLSLLMSEAIARFFAIRSVLAAIEPVLASGREGGATGALAAGVDELLHMRRHAFNAWVAAYHAGSPAVPVAAESVLEPRAASHRALPRHLLALLISASTRDLTRLQDLLAATGNRNADVVTHPCFRAHVAALRSLADSWRLPAPRAAVATRVTPCS